MIYIYRISLAIQKHTNNIRKIPLMLEYVDLTKNELYDLANNKLLKIIKKNYR